jgi:hypothetical protein
MGRLRMPNVDLVTGWMRSRKSGWEKSARFSKQQMWYKLKKNEGVGWVPSIQPLDAWSQCGPLMPGARASRYSPGVIVPKQESSLHLAPLGEYGAVR